MATVTAIDDPGDPRLAPFVGLTDADLRRGIETPATGPGLFVVEGVTAIRRLLVSDYPVLAVLVTPRRLDALAAALASVDAPVYVASAAVMAATVGFDIHRGAVAAARRVAQPAVADLLATARTLAVLEGINDHENLGAMARSAAALGVDALLLDPTCADPLYRRSVRVSMGEVLFLPHPRLTPWPGAIATLRAAGFRTIALTPAAEAVDLATVTLAPDERVAVLLGAEGPGLSGPAMIAADVRARIPLRPGFDSLNVGHAAAIAFHHVGRNRR